ncbi:MAG: hypothetical protein M1812_004226 [Candelaria pacifica]|nr:MAG: hypothetical protein M1812_004226 [Candelaria pacifica]
MAPSKPARADKAKKLNDTLNFADTLKKSLETSHQVPNILIDLKKHIQDFPRNNSVTAASKYEELDAQGTALWNLTTRLKRSISTDAELQDLCYVRVFAFQLLDCGQQTSWGTASNRVRLQKVALKAAKYCLDQKQLDAALKILEKAADYEEELLKPSNQLTPEDANLHRTLSAEYFILRTALSWRQSRLDMAEHMFRKASVNDRHLDPNTTESFADLLFEIGKSQYDNQQYDLAVKWLDRSYDVLHKQDLERLSNDAGELRISIIEKTVKALLGLHNEDARTKAWSLVNLLENDFGDKSIVLLLKLEMIATEPLFDAQGYYDGKKDDEDDRINGDKLQGAYWTYTQAKSQKVSSTDLRLTEHPLMLNSQDLACLSLDNLLATRIFSTENEGWIEKVFVTRLWIATSTADTDNNLNALRAIFDAVAFNVKQPLSAHATHAAQTLLWKRIESNYGQQNFAVAESWCRLALHVVFERAGDLNTAKIARKVILCALGRQDHACAREVYNQMSDAGKATPMTKYLMFKVALRGGDGDFAAECLNAVCDNSSEDATLLYACVLEAQQAGDKLQVAAALQKVLDRYDYGAPRGVHLPALVRCAARILIIELGDSKPTTWDATDGICRLFEGAAIQAKQSRKDPTNQVFTITELDWFSRNSYNLSLSSCAKWYPKQTLRLLQACIKFMDLYPKDMDASTLADLSLRRMFCDFLCACLIIVIARSEDVIETQLQYYLNLRSHVSEFRKRVQDQVTRLEGGAKDDLGRKYSTLLLFDFEAAVRLKAWDSLGQLIEECAEYGDSKAYENFADIILCSQAPTATMIVTLQVTGPPNLILYVVNDFQKIVNVTWRLEENDIQKLSRWIRSLFQIALPSDIKIAEHILDQMYNVAQDASKTGNPYPTEELEWMATTTFNRAVDFFGASDDSTSKRWAEKALSIAALNLDGGALHAVLQGKYLTLSWDEG